MSRDAAGRRAEPGRAALGRKRIAASLAGGGHEASPHAGVKPAQLLLRMLQLLRVDATRVGVALHLEVRDAVGQTLPLTLTRRVTHGGRVVEEHVRDLGHGDPRA